MTSPVVQINDAHRGFWLGDKFEVFLFALKSQVSFTRGLLLNAFLAFDSNIGRISMLHRSLLLSALGLLVTVPGYSQDFMPATVNSMQNPVSSGPIFDTFSQAVVQQPIYASPVYQQPIYQMPIPQSVCQPVFQQPQCNPMGCVQMVMGGMSPDGFPGVTDLTPFGIDPVDRAPLIDRPFYRAEQRVRDNIDEVARLRELIKVILKGQEPGTTLPPFDGIGLTEEQADAVIQAYLDN